jgi:hypothetical protein
VLVVAECLKYSVVFIAFIIMLEGPSSHIKNKLEIIKEVFSPAK